MTNDEFNFRLMISKRITFLRKRFNFTQKTIANRLGVSYNRLHNWESKGNPPTLYLIKLSKLYGISIELLFNNAINFQNEINKFTGRR